MKKTQTNMHTKKQPATERGNTKKPWQSKTKDYIPKTKAHWADEKMWTTHYAHNKSNQPRKEAIQRDHIPKKKKRLTTQKK